LTVKLHHSYVCNLGVPNKKKKIEKSKEEEKEKKQTVRAYVSL